MKLGEDVHGYRIVTKPTNRNGGMCVWAFAEKDGDQYFIKEFLDPKFPVDGSPGGDRSKAVRRVACAAFEGRHNLIMDRLQANVPGGGNIVIAHDFFREGPVYYKVTERIDPSNLEDLSTLTVHQQVVVLRTLASSVRLLHKLRIVHGDLKPANVLVQRRPGNTLYSAKLIDFDDSYLSGEPPDAGEDGDEVVVGDSTYGAPEWVAYQRHSDGAEASSLTCAVDMFALGLIMHRYLAGSLPVWDSTRFTSAGAAVNEGLSLVPVISLSTYVQGLVVALTDRDPARRPTIDEFITALEPEEVLDPTSVAGGRPYMPPRRAERAPRPKPTDRTTRLSSTMGLPGGRGPARSALPPEPPRVTVPLARPEPSDTGRPDDPDRRTKRSGRLHIRMDGRVPPEPASSEPGPDPTED